MSSRRALRARKGSSPRHDRWSSDLFFALLHGSRGTAGSHPAVGRERAPKRLDGGAERPRSTPFPALMPTVAAAVCFPVRPDDRESRPALQHISGIVIYGFMNPILPLPMIPWKPSQSKSSSPPATT